MPANERSNIIEIDYCGDNGIAYIKGRYSNAPWEAEISIEDLTLVTGMVSRKPGEHVYINHGISSIIWRKKRERIYNTHGIGLDKLIVGTTNKQAKVLHLDGDYLNCQRDNLQLKKPRHINDNDGFPYRGVIKHFDGRFRAFIFVNGSCKYLGLYVDPETAAEAHDTAARHHFGKFAFQNSTIGAKDDFISLGG